MTPCVLFVAAYNIGRILKMYYLENYFVLNKELSKFSKKIINDNVKSKGVKTPL